jgi:ribosomal-protein-alanine N-acetyltransferase
MPSGEDIHQPDDQGLKAIVNLSLSHLAAVCDIEQRSFADPWSLQMFRDELRDDGSRIALVLEEQGEVSGYLIGWLVLDEFHLGNIAVRPQSRGKGQGRMLLQEALRLSRIRGCRQASLEVRASNQPAIELYRKFGFRPVALRKKYYRDEDALVMLADLDGDTRC